MVWLLQFTLSGARLSPADVGIYMELVAIPGGSWGHCGLLQWHGCS